MTIEVGPPLFSTGERVAAVKLPSEPILSTEMSLEERLATTRKLPLGSMAIERGRLPTGNGEPVSGFNNPFVAI
jgi:hypothetical protein